MFETSLVRAHAMTAGHRYRFLTLSLAFHGCAIAAVITATIASTRLPADAPRQMETPILIPAVTLPPALGTPNAKPAAKPKRAAAAPRVIVAPIAIPSNVGQAPPAVQPETDIGGPVSSTETGGGDGPVGVRNGTPGGIGTDTSGTGQAATDAPLPVGGEVKAPIVIQRVIPEYPRVAMFSRMSGSVTVECIIDKTGHIRDARVVKSTFAAFDEPAIDAVQKWVFAPGTLHGQPVDTIFDLTVVFQVR